jgi:hypothetical protein
MKTTMKRIWAISFVALLSSGIAGCVTQSNARYDGAITFTLENDVITGSDNYTNGLGATVVERARDLRRTASSAGGDFWSFLPFVADEGYDTYALPGPSRRRCIRRTISRTRTAPR